MIRSLHIGLNGPDVKEVQRALNRHIAAGLVDDGKFGNNTRNAVVKFQQLNKLNPDGTVGSQTRSVLFPVTGVTLHVVGTYAGGDLLVGARTTAPPQAAGFASPALGARLRPVSAIGTPLRVGDTPSPDPLPPPIPDFLKNLPALRDPSSGPTDSFRMPNGVLLPVPPLLTAPLLNIPGMRTQSQQLQAGGSFNTRPLFQSQPGSPNPSGGFVAAFQSVLSRTKDRPGRLEIAEGLQVGKPFTAKTSDGTNWSLQWFVQFTWVDPFWQRGQFHLVQPFVQVGVQTDLNQGGLAGSVGVFPTNITFDIVQDRFSLFGQAGVVYGFNGERAELTGQAAFGASVTFGAF